jgi:hypothetical protein
MTNQRYSATIPDVTVATAVANSQPINYGGFASGMVHVPAGSSLTTLTWHACLTEDGTYIAAEDAASAAVTQTVAASQAHPIPAALAGARFLKVTGNAAGTIGITLKD